jgi:hypothetical protein
MRGCSYTFVYKDLELLNSAQAVFKVIAGAGEPNILLMQL